MVDWAYDVSPLDRAVNEARADIYEARAAVETSMMARGIFSATAREARSQKGR